MVDGVMARAGIPDCMSHFGKFIEVVIEEVPENIQNKVKI